MRTYSGLGFDPTPGTAAEVDAVLSRVEHAREALDGSAADLRRVVRAGGWSGPAADAFRAATGTLPAGLDDLATALAAASRTLVGWRSRLVANQREAELLDLVARRLRVELTAAGGGRQVVHEELARVLDRAGRLRARHLRQADDAARAVRSLIGAGLPAGWPPGSADLAARWSDRVTAWSGGVALGLATPVRPDTAVPGIRLASGDLAAVPGLPGREGAVEAAAPDVRGATASAGWLDTGTAAAHRLPQPPARHPVEPAATGPAAGSVNPAGTAPHRPAGTKARHTGAARHTDPPVRTGERPARADPPGRAEARGRGAATSAAVAPATASRPVAAATGADLTRPRIEPTDRNTGGDTSQAADRTVEQQATPAEPERRGPGQPEQAVERPAERPAGQPAERPGPRPVALEPGRLTAADPGPRPAPAGPPAQPVTGKDRDHRDDRDLVAVLVGPVTGDGHGTGDGEARATRPERLRAFLLHKPDARPVLAILRAGREPLLVTGLTPCAGGLPDCAAAVPEAATPTVY